MKERMKASDVYAQSNNPFVPKTDFEGAFPNIEAVTVEVRETDEYGHESKRTYTKNGFGQYINCSNRKCYNGGFAIGDVLQSLRFGKLTEGEGNANCQGHEGSPKGRKKGDSCEHKFHYKISVIYKKEEELSADSKTEE